MKDSCQPYGLELQIHILVRTSNTYPDNIRQGPTWPRTLMERRQGLQRANAFWYVPIAPYDDSYIAEGKDLLRQLEGIRWLMELLNGL